MVVICFAKDTLIATPAGDVAVQELAIGAQVLMAEGGACPVKWIGRQTVVPRSGVPEKMEPVRFAKDALGKNTPYCDLVVTANHGMIVDGLVINAAALVNGTTIDFVPASELDDEVTYYHVETENHVVILANGAPAETFIDYVGRQDFDNYQEYLDLYNVDRLIPEMDRIRISTARLVPLEIKARLGIVEYDIDFIEEFEPLKAG